MTEETKADAFKRLASARVQTVLDRLDILANCSNRAQYEYTAEQVEKIRSTIQTKLDFCMNQFSDKPSRSSNCFEL